MKPKVESVEEFLARGGEITKCGRPTVELINERYFNRRTEKERKEAIRKQADEFKRRFKDVSRDS